MRETGVGIKDIDEDQALDLIKRSNRPSYWKKEAGRATRRFVKFLVELGVAKPVLPPVVADTPRMRLRRDYEEYLRRQQGLAEKTIYARRRFAERFLEFRFPDDKVDLSRITSIDIASFIQHLATRGKPFLDKTLPSHLRNFFLFLFNSGRTATNLAPSIPKMAHRRGATLPRYVTPEQVETLITAVRTDTPIGRRNYAIVLLLARLGLRPAEVIAIQIDDINWRDGEILIRGKGQRHDCMPLSQEVVEALADYIQRGRVTTSRALFVTTMAPHKPFCNGCMLNNILKQAFAKAALRLPIPYVGAHVLRHSLATNLVRRGTSLAEVGNVLRHRSLESTVIYAKLDIEGLRSVAQPWPVEGGAK
jgi:site-specific recombinase XerD